jgi:type IV pilus assembly protein PilX
MEPVMNPSSLHMPAYANRAERWPCRAGKQSGAVLFVGLILLVMLTLLGITALQVSTLEERMAGNSRDRNLAFQAAESALRDAERDIQGVKIDGTAATTVRTNGPISGMTGADSSCTAGLCCKLNGLICVEPSSPVYQNFSLNASPSIAYGTYTAAPALTGGLSQQPRYLIEPFQKQSVNYYRITARGYGINNFTQVTLEEVYKGQQ